MSQVVKLLQGSPQWHAHRRAHRNASETPVVMGVSPWQTPYQLWQEKLGLLVPVVNTAMLRGTELEPAARAAYESLTGRVMQPLVLVEGEYSASLDGITLASDRVLEIKCPFKGQGSTLWQTVTAGRLPHYYELQVQHQLMVSGAAVADVYVFDGTSGQLLEVRPDPLLWAALQTAWDAFAQHLALRTAPPLSKGDVRQRDDPEWLAAAQAYILAKRAADEALRSAEVAKTRLVELATHCSESGAGVTVTRCWKRGNVDYSKVDALRGYDLEPYRGQPRQEVRVIVA